MDSIRQPTRRNTSTLPSTPIDDVQGTVAATRLQEEFEESGKKIERIREDKGKVVGFVGGMLKRTATFPVGLTLLIYVCEADSLRGKVAGQVMVLTLNLLCAMHAILTCVSSFVNFRRNSRLYEVEIMWQRRLREEEGYELPTIINESFLDKFGPRIKVCAMLLMSLLGIVLVSVVEYLVYRGDCCAEVWVPLRIYDFRGLAICLVVLFGLMG